VKKITEEELEVIYIGVKDISRYISAALFGFGKGETIRLIARGKNVKKTIDILAILIRDYIEEADYEIKVDSETFENRKISTIEVTLSGKKKVKKE
jgi:DNA-binding protein Alba